jgi:hypothetical protein
MFNIYIYNSFLSRDRSIVSSNLSVFGERLSRKSCNVVVFPFAFHIAVQQPLEQLWPRLLLCDHGTISTIHCSVLQVATDAAATDIRGICIGVPFS